MPRHTKFVTVDKVAYSVKTGKPLKNYPTDAEIHFGDYDEVFPPTAPEVYLNIIQTNAKRKSKMQRGVRGAQYHKKLEKRIPGARDHIAPTEKGTQRKVGQGKDSFLTQVNRSMAIVNNVPLSGKNNAHNRNIVRRIYADEIAAAYATAAADFKRNAPNFDPNAKKKKYWNVPYPSKSSRKQVARRKELYQNVRVPPGGYNPFA